MANQEQLDILKQGVEVWNKWRSVHSGVEIDLSDADLSDADLIRAYLCFADLSDADLNNAELIDADLSDANLNGTNLSRANLSRAFLSRANLNNAELIDANLSDANLSDADLICTGLNGANLSHANLSRAFLYGSFLSRANLSDANLSGANLREANLMDANLSRANLSRASLNHTIFGDVDLSTVKGLETVHHGGPSTIGIDTIIRYQGKIPEIFLHGAGVPDSIIVALRSIKPLEFYSCFISYSSKDQDFAERLYTDLQAEGVRCWLDKEELKIGQKFRRSIDEAIRRHDKLLLVLSQHSLKSSWVETEVETAFEKERRYKKLVLFPIRLDEAVMRTRQAWASGIRRQRHIGDFTCWKDHDAYQKAFTRLLRDLKAEAQKMET